VIGLWTAVAAIWLIAVVSATTAFPPPVPAGRVREADTLFTKARAAYLARDWLQAESILMTLLDLAPTDGEAQLLYGTLLRRTGRDEDARRAFDKLARSDSGAIWRRAIAQELDRMSHDEDPVIVQAHGGSPDAASRRSAA